MVLKPVDILFGIAQGYCFMDFWLLNRGIVQFALFMPYTDFTLNLLALFMPYTDFTFNPLAASDLY